MAAESGKKTDPKITSSINCGEYTFAWEEYWEEDDSGYCSVDFLWDKRTRLKILKKETGELVRTFPYDSGQRETALSAEGETVFVTYWPSFRLKVVLAFDAATLDILSRTKYEEE